LGLRWVSAPASHPAYNGNKPIKKIIHTTPKKGFKSSPSTRFYAPHHAFRLVAQSLPAAVAGYASAIFLTPRLTPLGCCGFRSAIAPVAHPLPSAAAGYARRFFRIAVASRASPSLGQSLDLRFASLTATNRTMLVGLRPPSTPWVSGAAALVGLPARWRRDHAIVAYDGRFNPRHSLAKRRRVDEHGFLVRQRVSIHAAPHEAATWRGWKCPRLTGSFNPRCPARGGDNVHGALSSGDGVSIHATPRARYSSDNSPCHSC
jgi:hypothetical protein